MKLQVAILFLCCTLFAVPVLAANHGNDDSDSSAGKNSVDTNDIIITALTALIGGIVGTYGGSYFIGRKQQKQLNNVREIAINALDLFKKYKNKTYHDAANDFNVTFTITDKRIIIVALYKIGIPVIVGHRGTLNLKNIDFMASDISESEIENMKRQIRRGNCDNLFFEDAEEYFNKNALDKYKRSIAIKFIDKVLKRTRIAEDKQSIIYPNEWWLDFSVGEINIVCIFKSKLSDPILYDDETRSIKQEKIQEIIEEINNGLWDTYLYWTYDAFLNVQAQNNMANLFCNMIPRQPAEVHPKNKISDATNQNITEL